MKKISIIEILLVALLVLSLFMNYTTKRELHQLQNYTDNYYRDTQNSISNISSNISSVLNDFKKESMWIQEFNCAIKQFKDDLKEADLNINLSIKDKNTNEKLFIVAISKNTNKKFEFELVDDGTLNYNLAVTLPTDNYDFHLIGKNTSFTRKDILGDINLNSYAQKLYKIDGDTLGGMYSNTNKKGHYTYFVAVNKLKNNKEIYGTYLDTLEIKEVTADVYYGEKYIETIDFLNNKNYTPIDVSEHGNSIPEIAREDFEHNNGYTRQLTFNGKYIIKDLEEMPDFVMLIKVKDNQGNTYTKLIGDYYSYSSWLKKLQSGEITGY